jgi:hypothetical protein
MCTVLLRLWLFVAALSPIGGGETAPPSFLHAVCGYEDMGGVEERERGGMSSGLD